MKKRFFSAFLAICMMLTIMPMTAMAADPAEEADPVFEMQDFNLWGENWPGAFNVGWKYLDGFDTTTITGLEVGLKNPAGELIVKYTASGEQLEYQRAEGYITEAGQSSAPFYKEYKGNPLQEGADVDWTVEKGQAFDKWNVATAYVTVTVGEQVYTLENTCTHQHEYTESVMTEAALKTEATEESGAVYYKTCAACGAISDNDTDTFIDRDPFAFEVTAPTTMVAGETCTTASVRLYAQEEVKEDSTVRIKISVEGPDNANADIIVSDGSNDYDLAEVGFWGPEDGFTAGAGYDKITEVKALRFDTAGTYTATFELLDVANENAVLAEAAYTIKVQEGDKAGYAFEINAPETMVVGENCTDAWARLYAKSEEAVSVQDALIEITVTGPEGAKPEIMAKDTEGTEWNLAEVQKWGPATGFPVNNTYNATTEFSRISFDKVGTYTATFKLVTVSDGTVLASGSFTTEVVYPFAFEVNAPTSLRVNQEYTDASVRLYANGANQEYEKTLIKITVDGPDGANPEIMAVDTEGNEWNLAKVGQWGPETGFPVDGNYNATTEITKLSFDKTGTYTATFELVDLANNNAVLASDTYTINVTRRSSGGSGHADTRYDVDVKDAANGTVKASSTGASEGATVTLTVTADEGYTLDKLTVTDKNDKEVKLTNKGDGKYTFTMPASDVTVEASFIEGSTLPFTDVSVNDWFYDAVRYMYENGCMNGLTDTTFGPDATTTRGMIVTMLYRHENEPTVAGGNPFADVKDTQYYADAINWAAENDIVTGYDETTFGPDDTITREQMATILYRYAAYKGYDTTQGGMAVREFADYEEISDWSMTAVTWAVNAELLNGRTNNNLDPQGNATRAEVATILMRFCENFVK